MKISPVKVLGSLIDNTLLSDRMVRVAKARFLAMLNASPRDKLAAAVCVKLGNIACFLSGDVPKYRSHSACIHSFRRN